MSCEKKRLHRSARIQKAFGENGQGCSIVPTFHHLPLPPILGGEKGLDSKLRVWEEQLFDKGKEKNTSDVTKMHVS